MDGDPTAMDGDPAVMDGDPAVMDGDPTACKRIHALDKATTREHIMTKFQSTKSHLTLHVHVDN